MVVREELCKEEVIKKNSRKKIQYWPIHLYVLFNDR